MADQVNVESFLFNFQAEHVFADSLFNADEIGDFLREMGYKKNALGNLMAEFSDAETVAKLQQLADGDPLKAALMDPNSGTGTRALDIRTPQGARLTGVGNVTFATGAVRHMYDAILTSNDTNTRFAGEVGHAAWQERLAKAA